MRHEEDRQVRNFEIRQWFYMLRRYYITCGMAPPEASEQAYDDIGMRYCLRETSIRKAINDGAHPTLEHGRLMKAALENVSRLKRVLSHIESELGKG